MASGKSYHFAYASNLLKERVYHTIGSNTGARVIGPAKLQDYKLGFDYYCEEWQGCKATAIHCPGSHIWGVLWEVTQADKAQLDRAEAVHLGTYRQFNVSVTTLDGATHQCFSYQLYSSYEDNPEPSPQYKDVIIRGAKQAKLPQDYVTFLEAIKDNGYRGHVHLYEDIINSIEAS